MQHLSPYDVVIAGAGPVGLLLACELRLAGVSVLVLERSADPSSPFKSLPFGMRGLSVPTVEALYRRGLLDAVAAPADAPTGGTPHWMRQARRAAGHFAGIPFYQDRIDAAQWPYRLADPGPAGFPLATSMAQIEAVLASRAAALGVAILRGAALTAFEQDADGVTVQAGDKIVRGHWLVGCDGGRSAVRKLGGFVFAGTDAEFTGYSVQATLAAPHHLAPGRHYTPNGMITYQEPGTIAMVDFDGGACHRAAPLTLEHVQSVLRRISGVAVTIASLELATTWTDRARQATTYRDGRVLLAGDAAHTHSPLGGQGLNLGLGDAMNLGWKLAATIRGDAPAGLLDTYFMERYPAGAQILDWSRAQVAVMRPQPASRAMESILRELVETSDGATWFAGRVWGLSRRLDLGDPHPLVGRSAPDFLLADGSRTGEHLRSGKGLLLDVDNGAPLRAAAGAWRGRIDYLSGAGDDAYGLAALLLRPDGIVAWAADATPDIAPDTAPDAAGFARAAARWFGGDPAGGGVL